MSHDALTQTIVTGSDPRGLPEFSALREEINKASHPSQPELNWKLVESLALTVFRANGVDLHTATYYTLARTRTQGLTGFCEGAELLAAMVSHDWDKFWPQDNHARTGMLDWFNTRTGNILRQQMSFSDADLPVLYRTERVLQLICDKLQQVELKQKPHVENLLYFVQNTRKRFEPQPKRQAGEQSQTTVRTLVYAPEGAPAAAEVTPPLPDLPDIRVEVHQDSTNDAEPTVRATPGYSGCCLYGGYHCRTVVVAGIPNAAATGAGQGYRTGCRHRLADHPGPGQLRATAATDFRCVSTTAAGDRYADDAHGGQPLAGEPATAAGNRAVEHRPENPRAEQPANERMAAGAPESAGIC